MGIGDTAGMETLKLLEKRLPHILGAADVRTLVTETTDTVEVRAKRLLGAPDVQSLVDATVTKVQADLDVLLTKHRRALQSEIIDHTITTLRQHAGTFVDREIEVAVQNTRKEAEKLVNNSLDRVSKDAKELVDQISKAISTQRSGAVTDVEQAASAIRKEMRPMLLWVAVIVGLTNFAGIIAAVVLLKN